MHLNYKTEPPNYRVTKTSAYFQAISKDLYKNNNSKMNQNKKKKKNNPRCNNSSSNTLNNYNNHQIN